MKTTQNDAIRKHLLSGRSITPMEALNLYGCLRLAARINDLRADGLEVITDYETKGSKTWARYRISKVALQLSLF